MSYESSFIFRLNTSLFETSLTFALKLLKLQLPKTKKIYMYIYLGQEEGINGQKWPLGCLD